jgi:hypothetical protein
METPKVLDFPRWERRLMQVRLTVCLIFELTSEHEECLVSTMKLVKRWLSDTENKGTQSHYSVRPSMTARKVIKFVIGMRKRAKLRRWECFGDGFIL